MTGKKDMRPAEALLSLATLLAAFLLVWQCADAYLSGNAPANRTETGLLIAPVFSREIAAQRLGAIGWSFVLWLGALAAAIIERVMKPKKRPAPPQNSGFRRMAEQTGGGGRRINAVRAALYAAAAALVIAGMMNGGMRDVLVKAINICTECIGLG